MVIGDAAENFIYANLNESEFWIYPGYIHLSEKLLCGPVCS